MHQGHKREREMCEGAAPKPKEKPLTDQPEKTQNAPEHLYHEDFDKQSGVSGVREGCCATCDADTETAEEVTKADCKAAEEEGEA
jgi:hypothetical protein